MVKDKVCYVIHILKQEWIFRNLSVIGIKLHGCHPVSVYSKQTNFYSTRELKSIQRYPSRGKKLESGAVTLLACIHCHLMKIPLMIPVVTYFWEKPFDFHADLHFYYLSIFVYQTHSPVRVEGGFETFVGHRFELSPSRENWGNILSFIFIFLIP